MHIRRFSSDRQLIRETPSGSPRLGSRKWCSVNRHFLIRQFSYGRRGKKPLHDCIAFKNHLFAHSGRPELLEGFAYNCRKLLPGRQWPEELHKSKPTDKLGPAGCQVKCQRGSPVLRDDECRRDSSVFEERIEIPNMIGKPILDVWLSRLPEPDQIRCDAARHRCDQRNNVSPDVRRRWIPVQKKRDRRFGISRFPVGHGGTQHIHFGQYEIRKDGHFFSSLNTVSKTMFLKRLSAAGPRSTFIRRIAPSQEARRNSARSIGSNVESISPVA